MTRDQIKDAVRARDGACVHCGLTNEQSRAKYGKQLDVHRTTPGSRYTLEGCETTCRQCHAALPRREKGQPDLEYSRYGPKVAFQLPDDLHRAFRKYVATLKPKASESAVLRLALERFLANVGYWPRTPPGQAGSI